MGYGDHDDDGFAEPAPGFAGHANMVLTLVVRLVGLAVLSVEEVAARPLGGGLHVPAARLDELKGHPGLMVHTSVELPGVDVQQLVLSPQGAKFGELPGRKMLAMGRTSRVVIVGPGSEVSALADVLRRAAAGGK